MVYVSKRVSGIRDLFRAVAENCIGRTRGLIGRKVPIDSRNELGDTPLMIAVRLRNFKMAMFLVNSGADLSLTNTNGEDILYISCMCGFEGAVDRMVTECSVNFEDSHKLTTPLMQASRKGSVGTVRSLLGAGASVDAQNGKGNTALIMACANGHCSVVSVLSEHDASTDLCNVRENTPLAVAVNRKRLDVVKILLNSGARVDPKNEDLNTPLSLACVHGTVDIIRYLVVYGANVNSKNIDHETPLTISATSGCLEAVEFLVNQGGNFNHVDCHGYTAVTNACIMGYVDVVEFLLSRGVSLDNVGTQSPLSCAASSNCCKMVEYLLMKGAKINSYDGYSLTPLSSAIVSGSVEATVLLLERGADTLNVPNSLVSDACIVEDLETSLEMIETLVSFGVSIDSLDGSGRSAIFRCAEMGLYKTLEFLISTGADTGVRDTSDCSVLHIAAAHGSKRCIDYLISIGFPCDIGSRKGIPLSVAVCHNADSEVCSRLVSPGTPGYKNETYGASMIEASYRNRLDVVLLLLENGVSPTVRGPRSRTPLMYSRESCITRALLRKDRDSVDLVDEDGRTALFHASRDGHLEVVEFLLDRGADIDIKDSYGTSPIEAAVSNSWTPAVQLLWTRGAFCPPKLKAHIFIPWYMSRLESRSEVV